MTPSNAIRKHYSRVGEIAQSVECLHCKHKSLGLIPSTTHKNKQTNKQKNKKQKKQKNYSQRLDCS